LPRHPKDPEKMALSRRKFGGVLTVMSTLIMLFGIAQLFGVVKYRGQQDLDTILVALKREYPNIVLKGGHSYEAERVYVQCLNVQEPAKQMEIRDWLCQFKAENKIGSVILLMFDDEVREPPEKFKL